MKTNFTQSAKRGLLFYLLCSLILQSCGGLSRSADKRPNFLIIITDDQRFDSMEFMPKTQELIFDQGVTFSKGFVTTPFCCPSRVSIFTGLYAHNHYVHLNEDKFYFKTTADDLHNNGYYTGLIGKYLNSWTDSPRPEFDYWVSFWGGEAKTYYEPRLMVNGTREKKPGYITYLLRDRVLEFLDNASKQSKPFLLYFTPNAPHQPYTPANEDAKLYADLPPYRPPNFNELDLSDKPLAIQERPSLTAADIAGADQIRLDQLRALASLDRSIAEIVEKLRDTGQLDNTFIVFISDNGLHLGEHRLLTNKSSAYEESIHVPFAIRYPPLIQTPYIEDRLVANIDIAPTIYELSNTPPPKIIDGTSIVKLLDPNYNWRTHLLLEAWPDRGHWTAIRTDHAIYIETEDQAAEFYDLNVDPYEMDNMVNQPEYQSLIAELKGYLNKEKQPLIPEPDKE
ncbi:MAG: sulfatase [Anaerolineales bacterium]|nr:sulfatase [Anaerolineales bacterium]